MSRMVSFVVLIAFIIVIGFLFYRVMAPFLLPIFLAALMAVIFYPLHRRVMVKFKKRNSLAAATTTLIIILSVLVPVLLVLIVAVVEGSVAVRKLSRETVEATRDKYEILRMDNAREIRSIESKLAELSNSMDTVQYTGWNENVIHALLKDVDSWQAGPAEPNNTNQATDSDFEEFRVSITELQKQKLPLDAKSSAKFHEKLRIAEDEFQDLKTKALGGDFRAWMKEMANPTDTEAHALLGQILNNAKGWLFEMGGRTTAIFGGLIIDLVIMIVAIFFFLSDGPAMVETAMRLSPLADHYEQELLSEFEKVSRAVVVGTLLSAVAQGLLGGIGYYFAGFESVIFLMLLTTGLAMVPFVGAAAVWVPASLWLLVIEERTFAAAILAIYGVFAISSVDNLIKPMILHGQSGLHPLLALLSVLGGVNALGPIGILVGPMVVAFLQTLLNILHRELLNFDSEQAGNATSGNT